MKIAHGSLVMLTALVMAAAASEVAAQDYPARTVTLVVPTGPGAGTDLLGRLLAQKLAERLGKPFVVENRAGAGAVIASSAVAKAAPDGYTLLMGTSTPLAINASVYKKLPYNPATDFVPLALVANVPFMLVVNPSLPVHSIADLVKLAKEKPGALSYGSAGPGTPFHLYMELFKSMTGINIVHIPYKGALPALNDLVAGHLQVMMSDFASTLPLVRAGKLRALGISSLTPIAAAPDIRPIAEAGIPNFEAVPWQMPAAPANTPKEIVDKLHAEIKAIMLLPDVQEQVVKYGMIPIDSPPVAELQRFVKAEIARWGKVVEMSGASAD